MKLVLLDPRDDVATAAENLRAGQAAEVATRAVEVRDDIPRGHKIALRDISRGEDILRYGEVIGRATADIAAGQHVHVHNLISKRVPGGDA